MLYISTRSELETYTAHVALSREYAADGGNIVPFRLPNFTYDEILELKDKAFNQIIADILNQFFSARLTLWDVDLAIGKSNVHTLTMSHRLIVAELWHNPAGNFIYVVDRLHSRLVSDSTIKASAWSKIAVWISVYFAIYGQLLSEGILQEKNEFDVVVPADDLLRPVSAHYARRMGLPINTVICSCSGENNLWDLVRRGNVATASMDDNARNGIEGLLYSVLGFNAVHAYLDACKNKRTFSVEPLQLPSFTEDFYCTVAGENRANSTINSFYRSNQYIIDPPAAICYSGLQDFRAGTGSGRMTLLLSEHTPLDYADQISGATGIAKSKLFEYVKL